MKREILFRGKSKKNGNYEYGSLLVTKNRAYKCNIVVQTSITKETAIKIIEVYPETIEQFTGLFDKNGIKIFEGDIVKMGNDYALISFQNGGFGYTSNSWKDFISFAGHNHLLAVIKMMEVISTIHDNPELLEANQ